MPGCISIQARARRPIGPKETDSLFVRIEEIIPGGVSHGSIGLGREEDLKFVDSGLKVQSPFGIPTV